MIKFTAFYNPYCYNAGQLNCFYYLMIDQNNYALERFTLQPAAMRTFTILKDRTHSSYFSHIALQQVISQLLRITPYIHDNPQKRTTTKRGKTIRPFKDRI